MRNEIISDKKLKRQLKTFFRLGIIFIICIIIVYLFPKVGNFQYEYQKGMPWRYETLIAPFDFPIYKTDDELQEEREKLTEEQTPIFNRINRIHFFQIDKFKKALHPFETAHTQATLSSLIKQLEDIYQAGLLQLPERWDANDLQNIKIVVNKVAKTVDFNKVYTLKKAYATLSKEINDSGLPKPVREKILSLNLNNYLVPNLEFDLDKTTQNHLNHLKNISLTQGMVQQGDIIISKRELVTA